MPAANEINQSIRICLALEPPFSLDLIVRTPENLRKRLAEGDSFLCELMATGKVLYEKVGETVGAKSRSRPGRRKKDSLSQIRLSMTWRAFTVGSDLD
jgi:hypothetical protein